MQRLDVMSDVCLPPGYGEASGIHYHPVGWHIHILLQVIHPIHEKEGKREREDEKTVGCKPGEPTGACDTFAMFLGETPFFLLVHLLPLLLLLIRFSLLFLLFFVSSMCCCLPLWFSVFM